jgi:RimJ/RimL family protein N-acetyltransferase
MAKQHKLADGRTLTIRDVLVEEAGAVLQYLEAISNESDFLSFGPGEFGFSEDQERQLIQQYHAASNQLFIAGCLGDECVSLLSFTGGNRPRNRHTGEFGMSVRKDHWRLGIGSAMLDSLIDWARGTEVVRKLNLRVRTDNDRAISLYKRKGFVTEGTIRKDVLLQGRFFDHYWMGLEL